MYLAVQIPFQVNCCYLLLSQSLPVYSLAPPEITKLWTFLRIQTKVSSTVGSSLSKKLQVQVFKFLLTVIYAFGFELVNLFGNTKRISFPKPYLFSLGGKGFSNPVLVWHYSLIISALLSSLLHSLQCSLHFSALFTYSDSSPLDSLHFSSHFTSLFGTAC